MTKQEAINWLQLDMNMMKFDPSTGKETYLNNDARKVIEAMEEAIKALREQISIDMMKFDLTKEEKYINNDINMWNEKDTTK